MLEKVEGTTAGLVEKRPPLDEEEPIDLPPADVLEASVEIKDRKGYGFRLLPGQGLEKVDTGA